TPWAAIGYRSRRGAAPRGTWPHTAYFQLLSAGRRLAIRGKPPRSLMMRLLPLVCFSATAFAAPTIHSSDFHPNPNFKHVRRFDAGAMQAGRVEQVGEVVILEGDDQIVSTSKNGWGVVFDSRAQNPLDIAKRFYTAYGDEFDEIIIHTTFDDQ